MGLPITDPDSLTDGVNIIIDTTGKTVQIVKAGGLSDDGVTIKCVYSKLKELWKDSSEYIKFPFPMGPITDEQFEMVNGWDWEDNTTRYLLRTGGWAVKDSGGVSLEEWASIISLGSIGATDQAYFLQNSGGSVTNFQLTGPVNQAIKVYGDASHGNFDYRGYLKVYCRIYQKTYAFSQLSEIGVSTLTYQAYRFPLANGADVKITHTDANIIGNTPYFGTATHSDTDGAVDVGDATFTSTGSFVAGDVGKWICIDSGTNAGCYKIITYTNEDSVEVDRVFPASGTNIAYSINPIGMSVSWYTDPQARNIGGSNKNFHVIINANDGTAEQVYEFIQYLLRQNKDIDYGVGTQIGQKTGALLRFVGDTLYTQAVTEGGVFIDNYKATDVNRLVFIDDLVAECTFPFVAVLTLNFGDNLVNDASAKYWVYFTNDDSGDNLGYDYGTANAIIVNSNEAFTTTHRACSASNVATIKTALNHGLVTGDGVNVSGMTDATYNGNFIVLSATSTSFTYALTHAEEVETADTAGTIKPNMTELINGATSKQMTFAYNSNVQRGTGSNATDAPITCVAIGLSTGQFVKATGTVLKSTSNTISLVAPLERNYQNV
jgi:hypothetical protein